jgi:uncharacterized protein YndB with AHSA1/START domain
MNRPEFVYVTYIATTPEKLWQALTERAFTEQYWFGTRIESTWVVGAPVNLLADGVIHDTGTVLEYAPPRRLSYTWTVQFHEVFCRERASRVTFDLEQMGPEVKLTVSHDDFEPGSKVLEAVSSGWPRVIASLKSLLETGRPLVLSGSEAAKGVRQEAVARATANANG